MSDFTHDPDAAVVLYDRRAIDALMDHQAVLMNARYANDQVLVLAVMTGALVYVGQLLPRLNFRLELDYVHATRYDGARSGGELQWRVHPRQSVAGRTVLLLDDILDEGVTLHEISKLLISEGAADVAIGVLVHKMKDLPQPCSPAFPALTIPDRYVYGFGLDADGLWRNADGIFVADGANDVD
ncbi:MAG: hypoxanthine-guanine phosphoribosyltransferase [Rhodocyclaceae bacterium]|jgi:hypoxanthine phosphoribosyltransferase|nr:hypoxanthine-guanine phosphoribosyltransferase [Rhodocyclaceae bacterium]